MDKTDWMLMKLKFLIFLNCAQANEEEQRVEEWESL
jgi:hypothetical protein